MRNTFTYSNQNFNLKNLLSYSKKFTYSSILLSNKIEDKYSQYQTVVCLGSKETLSSEKNSFGKLRNFHNKYKDWMFGFLSYDLKNEIENLNSENKDNFHVYNLFFFIPQTILLFQTMS